MLASKRIIISIIVFLLALLAGSVWAASPAAELNGVHRLLISALVGGLAAALCYVILRQNEMTRQSRDSLLASVAAREEMAADLSHQVRTPLSGILGVMHLLRRTQLDRNQQRYVDTASNSANMLLAIVKDLTAQAQADTSWFEVESRSLDLAEAVEDVTSILAPEAVSKHLELVVDIDPDIPMRVEGDPLRLRQVLHNLLINAIKYTERGVVSVYISRSPRGIEIGVRDSGPGLGPEQRRLLLQADSDAGASESPPEASSLGLRICRRLIKAMGSALQIESSPGEGSRFFFELAIDERHHAARDWKPPRGIRELSVGIVSPLALQRGSIAKTLAHWGVDDIREYDIDVESGADLDRIDPCGLLIVDQSGGEQAVNEFIERLRNRSDWRDTRFVQLLPQGREDEGGSADLRLLKPLSHSRLYSMLMDVIYKQAFRSEYTAAASAGAVDGHFPGNLHGRRILLVEDNDINKMIVLEMLEETGIDVDVAVDGAEAVEMAQQQHYDLVLMDIQMPVMDGYEATRLIRSKGGWLEKIPIIAMTAHAFEGDSGKSFDAGLDFHVTKPFEPDELIGVVTRFIRDEVASE